MTDHNKDRRHFLQQTRNIGLAAAVLNIAPSLAFSASNTQERNPPMTDLTLPELPYAHDALAPYMSAETLEYHHGKHHNAYATVGTELIAAKGMSGKSIEDIIKESYGKPDLQGLFNNVAQFWNHVHFWNWMKKDGGGNKLPGALEKAVTDSFGSYDAFRGAFIDAGKTQFGSGWAWLVSDDAGKLSILKTPNGENPLHHGKHAILGCDVWEHSYYIDYRNARPKYLEAFLDNLVNWEYAEKLYTEATS